MSMFSHLSSVFCGLLCGYLIIYSIFPVFFCYLIIFWQKSKSIVFTEVLFFILIFCVFSCIKSALTFSVRVKPCLRNEGDEWKGKEDVMQNFWICSANLIVTYLMTLLCVRCCMCVCVWEWWGKGFVPGPLFLKAFSDLETTTTAASSKLSSLLCFQLHLAKVWHVQMSLAENGKNLFL